LRSNRIETSLPGLDTGLAALLDHRGGCRPVNLEEPDMAAFSQLPAAAQKNRTRAAGMGGRPPQEGAPHPTMTEMVRDGNTGGHRSGERAYAIDERAIVTPVPLAGSRGKPAGQNA
jgi:hypothetical protein